jgi:cytochrome P450
MRYFHIWNNQRIMNKYIDRDLDARYDILRAENKSKTIIDLALSGYKAERDSKAGSDRSHIDATFRAYARSQLKVFIFAGHDASATTICYAWLLLSRNPAAMAKLRAEHDVILGPDSSTAPAKLIESPQLINRLPYTLAVIKETLRLFPVVSAPRKGNENVSLTSPQGQRFPTEHCFVWTIHHGVHHNPLSWPRVEEFLPERFLGEDEALRPKRHAWRPFETGPRGCIGMELALQELKVVLALTVRDFDLTEAYEEWDALNKPKGVKMVNGERAYQIQLGSAHPVDGFPVRIAAR